MYIDFCMCTLLSRSHLWCSDRLAVARPVHWRSASNYFASISLRLGSWSAPTPTVRPTSTCRACMRSGQVSDAVVCVTVIMLVGWGVEGEVWVVKVEDVEWATDRVLSRVTWGVVTLYRKLCWIALNVHCVAFQHFNPDETDHYCYCLY